MSRFAIWFAWVLAFPSVFPSFANAEKFVVDLECVVFDRDGLEFTDAEKEQLNRRGEEPYSEAWLRIMRENSGQKLIYKSSLVVGQNETASHLVDSDALSVEAHVRLIEVNKDSCKIDIQWGVVRVFDDRTGASSGVTSVYAFTFGKEQYLGGGGPPGNVLSYIARARKATAEDLAPRKLRANFGDDLWIKLRALRPKGAGTDAT